MNKEDQKQVVLHSIALAMGIASIVLGVMEGFTYGVILGLGLACLGFVGLMDVK